MDSLGSLGGIHGSLGGTDETLGPMGPGPQGPPIVLRGYFLRVVYRSPALKTAHKTAQDAPRAGWPGQAGYR